MITTGMKGSSFFRVYVVKEHLLTPIPPTSPLFPSTPLFRSVVDGALLEGLNGGLDRSLAGDDHDRDEAVELLQGLCRKRTPLNSNPTDISPLPLHAALPICSRRRPP